MIKKGFGRRPWDPHQIDSSSRVPLIRYSREELCHRLSEECAGYILNLIWSSYITISITWFWYHLYLSAVFSTTYIFYYCMFPITCDESSARTSLWKHSGMSVSDRIQLYWAYDQYYWQTNSWAIIASLSTSTFLQARASSGRLAGHRTTQLPVIWVRLTAYTQIVQDLLIGCKLRFNAEYFKVISRWANGMQTDLAALLLSW